MRRLGERIGLNRVAALLVGCALGLEIVRLQVLPRDSRGGVACTLGEVVFLALAVAVVVAARRDSHR